MDLIVLAFLGMLHGMKDSDADKKSLMGIKGYEDKFV